MKKFREWTGEYEACKTCKTIEDCPHPEVDMLGTPIPPLVCIRPWDILTRTWKEHKEKRKQ